MSTTFKNKKQERERLQRERATCREELTRLREQMMLEVDHDTDEGDPDIYEREKTLALIQALERKAESIEYALKTLEQGDYGICERCGNPIGLERLKAMPGTTLCVKCKGETEKLLRRGFGSGLASRS